MLSVEEFEKRIKKPYVNEDSNSHSEIEDKIVFTGDHAEYWIHKIENEGTESVLQDLKREYPDWMSQDTAQESHEDMHKVEHDDAAIFWSKHGEEPRVILSTKGFEETASPAGAGTPGTASVPNVARAKARLGEPMRRDYDEDMDYDDEDEIEEECCAGTASAPGTAAVAPNDGGSQATGVARYKVPLGVDPHNLDDEEKSHVQTRYNESENMIQRRVEAGQTDPSDILTKVEPFKNYDLNKDGTYKVPEVDKRNYKTPEELTDMDGVHDEEDEPAKSDKELNYGYKMSDVLGEGINVKTEYDNIDNEEERISTIDRRAVESAAYFMLRGLEEDTIASFVEDACTETYDTEEALSKLKEKIQSNKRVADQALDNDELDSMNEFRKDIRKKIMGLGNRVSPFIVDPDYADDGDHITTVPGGYEDPEDAGVGKDNEAGQEPVQMLVDQEAPEIEMRMAELQKEIAEIKTNAQEEIAPLRDELEDLRGDLEDARDEEMDDSLLEATEDVTVDALVASWQGQQENFANAVMELNPEDYQQFVTHIDKAGFNILGRSADNIAQDDVVSDDDFETDDSDVEVDVNEPADVDVNTDDEDGGELAAL